MFNFTKSFSKKRLSKNSIVAKLDLILTEQRAQRVDLARLYRVIKDRPQKEIEDFNGDSDSEHGE